MKEVGNLNYLIPKCDSIECNVKPGRAFQAYCYKGGFESPEDAGCKKEVHVNLSVKDTS